MSLTEPLESLKTALTDRYTLERELGRGGMATVYLAFDRKHDRRVALKVLHPELAASVGPERFLREIRLTAQLEHSHILPVHDSGEAAGTLWYTMPYVEGESLRDRLRREIQLPVEEAVRLAREVADALDCAHGHGIVHRDIKPENILLSHGHARVADFGIARALEAAGDGQLTDAGLAVGTPAYMSPEQAAGGKVDGRSDIYALGCVVYEMLAGEPPFTGPTPQALAIRRVTETPRPLDLVRERVPAALGKVVQRALARVPADRFASPGEFTHALEAAAAVPPGQSSPPAQSHRAARSRAWIAATIVLAVAAVVLWGAGRRQNGETVSPDPHAVAVLPFRVAEPALGLWREGLVDLFATDLDGLADLRAIHPRTVLSRWYRDVGDNQEVDQATLLRVAEHVGASYALTGSLTGSKHVRLDLELYPVAGGPPRRAQGQGPADSIPMLVDQLTVSLLREVLPSGTERSAARLSQSMTSSLPALKAYLAGEQKFRRARPQAAAEDFAKAVQLDSTFAVALYRLALAEGWTVSPHFLAVEGPDHARQAARHAGRLAPRDAALVRALTLLNPGLVQALDTLTALAHRYPDDAEVWFLLGDALFHLGGAAVQPPDAFRDALDRSIRLDSGFAPAYLHLAEDAFDRLDSATVRRISASLRSIDPSSPKAMGISLAYDLAWGDSVGRTAARRALDTMPTLALLTAKHAMNATPELGAPALAVAHVLATQDRHPRENRAQGWVGKGWVHFSRGQLKAGREMLREGMRQFGAPEWYLESFVLQLFQYPYLAGVPDSLGARKSYELTKAGADTLADPEWMGRLAAMYGEWDQVRRWRKLMDLQISRAQQEGDSLTVRGYKQDARILDALLEDKGRNGASVLRELQRASRAYPLGQAWSTNEPLLRIEIARRHAGAGNLREAERYLASVNFLSAGWPLVRGAVEFQRAQIAERLGDTEKARALYGRVVNGLRDCDPELRPFLLESRRALQRTSEVARR